MNHKKWIRLVCTVLALLLFVTGSGVSFAMAEQPDKETVLTEEQAATPETAESARLSLTVLDSDYSGSENGNIDESLFNTETDHAEIAAGTLPQDLIDAINQVGFWDSIPLWAVTLIGGLLITVLSFVMILTVYGRMLSLWMYAAIAPIPLSSFAGEPTSNVGKNFLRSYAGVCLQGVVIALACIIFSAVSSSPPAVDTSVSVVTAVWTYVGELAFNLLVLVGAVKGCDRIVKEIMGL